MQSPAQNDSTSTPSFAGFLAAITHPDKTVGDRDPNQASSRLQSWNNELLAEDVATLSYERALRAHARYHPDDPVAATEDVPPVGPDENAVPQPEAVAAVSPNSLKLLKEASITIRLSREEDAQLRKRAAEAGLTVSAYIRSCTFEAESLRALVKDALTQLRTAEPHPQQETNSPNRRRRWSTLFWPGRRRADKPGPNQA